MSCIYITYILYLSHNKYPYILLNPLRKRLKCQSKYIVKYLDIDCLSSQLHVSTIIPQLTKFIKQQLSSFNVASYLYSKEPNDSDCNHVIDELNEFYVCKTILKLSNPNLLAISRWSIKSIYRCLCIKSEKIIKDDFSHGWLGWGTLVKF